MMTDCYWLRVLLTSLLKRVVVVDAKLSRPVMWNDGYCDYDLDNELDDAVDVYDGIDYTVDHLDYLV